MPIQIDSVINEITPEQSVPAGGQGNDLRWQKVQEIEAILDQQRYQQQRLSAEDYED